MPTDTAYTVQPDDRLAARLTAASRGGSVAVVLVGCVVLLGWTLDIAPLKGPGQSVHVVKANTAILFLLAGASLWLALAPRSDRYRYQLARACAFLVTLIALASLGQDLSGWDLGIDQLLFTETTGAFGTFHPGRMAPNTALMFVLAGLGLFLIDQTRSGSHHWSQFLTLAAGAIATSGVIGHAYSEHGLYAFPHASSMAFATAVVSGVLCLSVLFARPTSGLMAFVTDRGAVGVLIRRLLPVALLVPPAFGWLGLWGERNALYNAAVGAVLVAVANMTALASIAWVTARALTRAHAERARVAEALAKSERLQNAIFNSVNFSSIATDAKGVIQLFNVGAERMLGFTAAEVLNRVTPADLSDPRELIVRAEALSLECDTPIAPGFEALAFKASRGIEDIYELTYIRKDGTRIPAVVSVTALRDAHDDVIGYLLIGTDNAARKQADDERLRLEHQLQQKNTELEDAGRTLEAQFRQANKMDAIGQLAAGVAHDFNNLLTVILGFSELITEDASLATNHLRDLEEITKAARRASGLTKQLLSFSRQQALSTIPLDVNALVTDLSGMLGRIIGEQVTITLTLDPGLCPVLADRGQLEQVVMNLVVNARDAMPDGGRVTIETSSVVLEQAELDDETIVPGTYVRLSIADTGIGMSQDTKAHLFEPFFTTKGVGKGTGLGLSTVSEIIRHCKGHISVESEPGRGTTFLVYLPDSDGAGAAVPDIGGGTAPPESRPATVLLVDDDEGVRRLATRVLNAVGYRVFEAASGPEAEKLFAQYPDAIDLLITDVVMPGCSGPELVRRLRVHTPALPAIFMSGYLSAQQRALMDPSLPFVQKPFAAVEFSRRVAEVLHAATPI